MQPPSTRKPPRDRPAHGSDTRPVVGALHPYPRGSGGLRRISMYGRCMSDWDVEDQDEETSAAPSGPAALRAAYEKQKQESQALAKQLQELRQTVRAGEVRTRLAKAGLPERAVELFPADLDPTEEAVTDWVGKYGDLFGAPASASPPAATPQDAPAAPVPDSPPVDREAMEQIQRATTGGAPVDAKSTLAQMLANPRLEHEVPMEQFIAAMRAAQGG